MPRKTKESKNKKIKKIEENNKGTKDEKFSFDEEIVIGLKRIDEPKVDKKQIKSKQKKNKKNMQQNIIIKSKHVENYEEIPKINKKTNQKRKKTEPKKLTKQQEIAKKKRKIIFKIIRLIMLIGLIIAGAIYAMLSPIFNIKNITVQGNSKIASETIVSLSGLNINQNIFNFRTSKTVELIKENPYIESVDIKRELPDKIEIFVTERKATFMITLGNAYVYLNNQGYMLETNSQKGELILLEGYKTSTEEIHDGGRLCIEDLENLNDVLKIIESIDSLGNNLKQKITLYNNES